MHQILFLMTKIQKKKKYIYIYISYVFLAISGISWWKNLRILMLIRDPYKDILHIKCSSKSSLENNLRQILIRTPWLSTQDHSITKNVALTITECQNSKIWVFMYIRTFSVIIYDRNHPNRVQENSLDRWSLNELEVILYFLMEYNFFFLHMDGWFWKKKNLGLCIDLNLIIMKLMILNEYVFFEIHLMYRNHMKIEIYMYTNSSWTPFFSLKDLHWARQ